VKALWKVVFGLAVCFALPPTASMANTATANITVTATVANVCSVTATTLAFGAYDGLIQNATAPLNILNAVLTYACNKGTAPNIGLDAGQNATHASGTTRAMKATTTANYLSYELYSNSTYTSVWGNSSPSWVSQTAALSHANQTVAIYPQIPAGQDAVSGSYADTITATINF
jgi:spore coat protein U-like protein